MYSSEASRLPNVLDGSFHSAKRTGWLAGWLAGVRWRPIAELSRVLASVASRDFAQELRKQVRRTLPSKCLYPATSHENPDSNRSEENPASVFITRLRTRAQIATGVRRSLTSKCLCPATSHESPDSNRSGEKFAQQVSVSRDFARERRPRLN